MDKLSRQRRQLLLYLGLSVVGAGAATACGSISRNTGSTAAVTKPIAPPTTSSTPTSTIELDPLASARSALPDFQGISQWLNSPPTSIASLKGNVVLVQFWTFACINCQRTLPSVVRWHQQYAQAGLKVIGIHTPEFAFERDTNNIKRALKQHQITYPVPIDNDFKTWKAYNNEYWPHLFLADRQSLIRYDHIGEGAYDTTEKMIQQLLTEKA